MQAPGLTVFRVSHNAVRTDAARLASAVAAVVEPERTSRGRSLSRWFGAYLDELHDHHSVEDELYFPALLARVLSFDRHLGRIESEHNRLDELLQRSDVAINRLADPTTPWPEASAEATEATTQLRALLDAHLGFEDSDVVPLYSRHFGAKGYEEIEDRAKKYLKVGHLPFIPWILEAASEDEQRRMRRRPPGLQARLVRDPQALPPDGRRRLRSGPDSGIGGSTPRTTTSVRSSGFDTRAAGLSGVLSVAEIA